MFTNMFFEYLGALKSSDWKLPFKKVSNSVCFITERTTFQSYWKEKQNLSFEADLQVSLSLEVITTKLHFLGLEEDFDKQAVFVEWAGIEIGAPKMKFI